MQICAVAIIALCATQFHPSFADRIFGVPWYSSEHPADRLLTLMRNVYVIGENRVRQLMYQRSLYESTLHFEMGYVMGEIIERYRQMVLHLKNSIKFKNYKLFDKLIRLEFMQKLYFEIYHLVMMMHELPHKYGRKDDELTFGIAGAKNDNSTLFNAMADLPAREKERERVKKQKMKEMQVQMTNFKKFGITPKRSTKGRSHLWPIDYGWSIEEW